MWFARDQLPAYAQITKNEIPVKKRRLAKTTAGVNLHNQIAIASVEINRKSISPPVNLDVPLVSCSTNTINRQTYIIKWITQAKLLCQMLISHQWLYNDIVWLGLLSVVSRRFPVFFSEEAKARTTLLRIWSNTHVYYIMTSCVIYSRLFVLLTRPDYYSARFESYRQCCYWINIVSVKDVWCQYRGDGSVKQQGHRCQYLPIWPGPSPYN